MNKKILGTIFSCLLVLMALAISGCKKEHALKSEWSYDAEGHYHECTDCTEKHDYVSHSITTSWQVDGDNHFHKCTVCEMLVDEESHDLPDEWKSNGTIHYQQCTICKELVGTENHTFLSDWQSNDATHYRECTVCGQRVSSEAHTYANVPQGNEHYHAYECTICGREGNIQSHVLSAIMYNEEGHFNQCTICNEMLNFSAHSFVGSVCDCGYNSNVVIEYNNEDAVLKVYENGYMTLLVRYHYRLEAEWVIQAEGTYDFETSTLTFTSGKKQDVRYKTVILRDYQLNENDIIKTNTELYYDEDIIFLGITDEVFLLKNATVEEVDLTEYYYTLLTRFDGEIELFPTSNIEELIADNTLDISYLGAYYIDEGNYIDYYELYEFFDEFVILAVTELDGGPIDLNNETYRKIVITFTVDGIEYTAIVDLAIGDGIYEYSADDPVVPLGSTDEVLRGAIDIEFWNCDTVQWEYGVLSELEAKSGIKATFSNFQSSKEGYFTTDVDWKGYKGTISYIVLELDENGSANEFDYRLEIGNAYSFYYSTPVLYAPLGATNAELKDLFWFEVHQRDVSADEFDYSYSGMSTDIDSSSVTLVLDTSTAGGKMMIVTYRGLVVEVPAYVYEPDEKLVTSLELVDGLDVTIIRYTSWGNTYHRARPSFEEKAIIKYLDGTEEEITLTEDMFYDYYIYYRDDNPNLGMQVDLTYVLQSDRGPIYFEYFNIDPTKFMIPVEAKAGTCSTVGNIAHYRCQITDKYYQDENGTVELTLEEISLERNPSNHSLVHFEDEVPATCIATGVIAHYKCNGCNKLYSDFTATTEVTAESLVITINPDHHSNIVFLDEVPATCTETGIKSHYKCEGCNDTFEDENGTTVATELTLPLVTHTVTLVAALSPTCALEGYAEHYECGVCHKWFADSLGAEEVTPTYIAKTTTHSLTYHQASTISCTEPGHSAYYSCSICNNNFTDDAGTTPFNEEIVAPLGHKWVASANGVFTCDRCECAKPDDMIIKEVIFKSGIVAINENAFSGNTDITSVYIPASVQTIGTRAFAECTSLKNIIFEEGSTLQEIGISSFTKTKLYEFVAPEGLKKILQSAFSETPLLYVVLPTTLETIESESFLNCTKMVEVVNLSNIAISLASSEGGNVARHAKSIINNLASSGFKVENNFAIYTTDGKRLLCGYIGDGNEITLPAVDRIDDYAFYRSNIEKVTMPDTISEIGSYAFAESALRYIYLSNAIKVIEEGTFSNCKNLLIADLPTSLEAIETRGFEYCERLLHFQTPSSDLAKIYDALPGTLITIGSNAFHEAGIVSIRLPASLSGASISSGFGTLYHIRQVYNYTSYSVNFANQKVVYSNVQGTNLVFMQGDYVFYHDKDSSDNPVYRLIHYIGLDKEILLPEKYLDSSYVIDNYAFFANKILERVNLHNADVTEIGSYAFQFTDNLQYIHLPANGLLTTIKDNAFRNTGGLLGIWIPSSVTSIGRYIFYYTRANIVISYAGPTGVISATAFNNSAYTLNCNVAVDPHLPIG